MSLDSDYDAVVVGGSFAGLAAAMQLARARRRVLVVDAGLPRNRFSPAAHGILGHDGKAPAQILEEARAQLLAYPTASLRKGRADTAEADGEGFRLTLEGGEPVSARRLVLATGVTDRLQPVPGLEERWGTSVLHCPYCHGYETGGGRLGVLGRTQLSVHQGMLIPEWGPTTLFLNDSIELSPGEAEALARRDVDVVAGPVARIYGEAPRLEGLEMRDGRRFPIDALFVMPSVLQASALPEQLGCAMEESPMGPYVRTSDFKETTTPGVFAAGDAARPMHSGSFALADGALAGIGAHRSLMGLG